MYFFRYILGLKKTESKHSVFANTECYCIPIPNRYTQILNLNPKCLYSVYTQRTKFEMKSNQMVTRGNRLKRTNQSVRRVHLFPLYIENFQEKLSLPFFSNFLSVCNSEFIFGANLLLFIIFFTKSQSKSFK